MVSRVLYSLTSMSQKAFSGQEGNKDHLNGTSLDRSATILSTSHKELVVVGLISPALFVAVL